MRTFHKPSLVRVTAVLLFLLISIVILSSVVPISASPEAFDVIIIKEVVGKPPSKDWEYEVTSQIGQLVIRFTIPADGGEKRLRLPLGPYIIIEKPQSLWSPEVHCTNGFKGTNVARIIVPPAVKCTFINTGFTGPYFTNITEKVGLSGVPGFRISVADVNGDHYPDIFLHQELDNLPPNCVTCKKQALYLNVLGDVPGDPHSRKFVDITEESGVRASRRGTNDRRSELAIFADVDNDGDLDMFTGLYAHWLDQYADNGDRNELLLNDGQGHFTLAPNSPFHHENLWNTAAATFLDYNKDGNIDLFIGNWYGEGRTLTDDQLYQGHGDGSFTNVTSVAGIDAAPTCVYAVTAADWNNDGFTDLFAPSYSITIQDAESIHWRNNGDGTFIQVQESTKYSDYIGYGTSMASFGSMPRDFDNDGDADFFEIITHGYGDGTDGVHSTVMVNDGNVFSWDFYRVDGRGDEDTDLSHHGDHYASWFDIENDGLADLVLTESGYGNNGLYLFEQMPGNTFNSKTLESGLWDIDKANLPAHNVVPLDFDLDGDEDLLIGIADKNKSVQLWRNDVGTLNNWLVLTLEGAGIPGYSNKSSIGARVKVTAGGEIYTREIYAGNGHAGPQVPLSLTFGLGQTTIVDKVEILWPSQITTKYWKIAANQFIRVFEPIEGTDGCAPLDGNLIQNFCFTGGYVPWRFWDGDGGGKWGVSTSNPFAGEGSARIVVNAPGRNIQLYQKELALQPNTTYELSFAAYSEDGRDMGVVVHKHGKPYTNYGLHVRRVDLDKAWRIYSYTFDTPDLADMSDGRLRFWFAPYAEAGTVYHIDHVVLRPEE